MTSGILTLGTGAYGFLLTNSRPSLIGGAALASAFFSAAYMIQKTEYQTTAHSLAAVAGTVALFTGAKRLSIPSTKFRLGPYSLLLVGVFNVPYQYFKAYEWSG